MPVPGPSWIVLTRDITGSVPVEGEPVVMASLVIDLGTGQPNSYGVGITGPAARDKAFREALAQPSPGNRPGPPARVICPGDAATVADELAAITGKRPRPAEGTYLESEDRFDIVISLMRRQAQPKDRPDPGDWAQLFSQAYQYRKAQPWLRRDQNKPLDLVVTLPRGGSSRYVAQVQHRAEPEQSVLRLIPGTDLPASERRQEETPTALAELPAGTFMFYLSTPAENVPYLVARAHRYGWPVSDSVTPMWYVGTPDGRPADLGQEDTYRLSLALTAIVGYDRQQVPPGQRAIVNGKAKIRGGEGRFRISESGSMR